MECLLGLAEAPTSKPPKSATVANAFLKQNTEAKNARESEPDKLRQLKML